MFFFFFFNDTATTEIYTLSLHDALPISSGSSSTSTRTAWRTTCATSTPATRSAASRPTRSTAPTASGWPTRSEEHTSELQSRQYLVCRLLLEKKKKNPRNTTILLV